MGKNKTHVMALNLKFMLGKGNPMFACAICDALDNCNMNNWAHCFSGAIDSCNILDQAGCSNPGVQDICDSDTGGCTVGSDICGVDS